MHSTASIVKIIKTLLLTVACLVLFACSKVTQQKFDQIKPNMTMQEVTAILGEPTSSESVNVAGISGTSAVWRDENAEISIQFLNDRVAVKAFNKSPEAAVKPIEKNN